ncbi:hypothetical protein EDB81DRAFT_765626 [Dactylonectria macrodidyma]|uniref:Rhodopsin domain-containing protein n=1 Tax=Dactylonectria macrodidyma TaxID=307937 RepID=A0A9P9DR73_9HYPO|nr:hypothetical protein EDB81DRAFT_765626 [Dactylonectria macrodidyma]
MDPVQTFDYNIKQLQTSSVTFFTNSAEDLLTYVADVNLSSRTTGDLLKHLGQTTAINDYKYQLTLLKKQDKEVARRKRIFLHPEPGPEQKLEGSQQSQHQTGSHWQGVCLELRGKLFSAPQQATDSAFSKEIGFETIWHVLGLQSLLPGVATLQEPISCMELRGVTIQHKFNATLDVVHLVASFEEALSFPIFRGPVLLTLDSSFVGTTTLPDCFPGETFTLSSLDPGMIVTKTLDAGHGQSNSLLLIPRYTQVSQVLVILRVLAFFQSRKPLSPDVCMVILSLFWNLSVIGLMAGMIQHGVGLAVIEVPSDKLNMIERLQRAAEILYVYALAWTKISLLLLLRHIFAVKIKRSTDILGGFIGIWAVAMTPLCILACNSILKTGHSGHCVDKASIWIANAALKAISDCAMLILPLPSTWRLKTGISQKILLTGQFGLGLLPTIASAYQFKKLTLYSPGVSVPVAAFLPN